MYLCSTLLLKDIKCGHLCSLTVETPRTQGTNIFLWRHVENGCHATAVISSSIFMLIHRKKAFKIQDLLVCFRWFFEVSQIIEISANPICCAFHVSPFCWRSRLPRYQIHRSRCGAIGLSFPMGRWLRIIPGYVPNSRGQAGLRRFRGRFGTSVFGGGFCRWGIWGCFIKFMCFCFFPLFLKVCVPKKYRCSKKHSWNGIQSLGHMAGRKFHTQHHHMIWSFW